MPTVNATPNDPTANSFITTARADTYWSERLFSTPWTSATPTNKQAAVIQATRVLSMMFTPHKVFVPPTTGVNARDGYFRTGPQWTGTPATSTQRLPWGRIGMYDRNGNAIAPNVIPFELEEATAELAGQLLKSDRMLDNNIAVKGITDLKAGPVALSFKDDVIMSKPLPDSVMFLLVPSWFTSEVIESLSSALFDVVPDGEGPERELS